METLAGLILAALCVGVAGWFLLPVIVSFGVALSNASKAKPNTTAAYEAGRSFARKIWQTQKDPAHAAVLLNAYANSEQLKVGKDFYCAYSKGVLDELDSLRGDAKNGN